MSLGELSTSPTEVSFVAEGKTAVPDDVSNLTY